MTDVSGTVDFPISPRRLPLGDVSSTVGTQSRPITARPVSPFAALLALIGAILPTELQINIAGARFSAGRIAIIVLFLPALFKLFKTGRRILLCDFLAAATAGWIVVVTADASGTAALSVTAIGEALDFIGGYIIGRAYFFGRASLNTFVRVLKALLIIVIILAVADFISGRLIVHDTIANIINASSWPQAGYRNNMVRAASTFDHEIAFGLFCSFTAAILLYWENGLLRRTLYAGACFIGCLLSMSSAALISYFIIVIAYTYDRLMKNHSWRWGAFWTVLVMLIFAVYLIANNPLSWILSHLTFNPQTGWYRILIWEAALAYIDLSPVIGYGYRLFNSEVLDNTVDSVWLVLSLRSGVPLIILLFLTNVAAFFSIEQGSRNVSNNSSTGKMRRAFTLVLLMFMFAGMTVHYWNFIWMFWGLCIGIRASLRELPVDLGRKSYNSRATGYYPRGPAPA